ncbi:hypothetical protein A2164_03070 [Candidatus Curtissbacteria bacterium RBG_13_35_7]|uniref:General secretion pathway GspH domain-containing protein n=1 Tax=Candidatus Curtissbacteria bacterium RBG_13_35_7 TaxID=1797705 RepID=A0A1F5G1E8_9BACT|nr:MAG: hypothetical protein A2164_03070 [Candidatus Curtissbacteria bacterium RBG_13_35_7]
MNNEKGKFKNQITIHSHQRRSAFTLIEILLVIAIFAILAGFTTINLIKPQTSASINSTVNTLVADIKEQQLKSMVGDTEGQSIAQTYGVRFETNRYILFHGMYNPSEPSNFEINLDSNTTFTNLPSTQEFIFLKKSGEIINPNSLTIQNNETNEQKTLTINRLGAITIN